VKKANRTRTKKLWLNSQYVEDSASLPKLIWEFPCWDPCRSWKNEPDLGGHEEPAQVGDSLVPDAKAVQVDAIPTVHRLRGGLLHVQRQAYFLIELSSLHCWLSSTELSKSAIHVCANVLQNNEILSRDCLIVSVSEYCDPACPGMTHIPVLAPGKRERWV
jgi:hypothetical protein